MSNDYRSMPTEKLLRKWEALRNRLSRVSVAHRNQADVDALLEMRMELDRRNDEHKPIVDINFSNDYLTD